MMHGPEKSDPAIVAMKPTNDAGQPAAEPVEQRAGTKGNADARSTRRTQGRERVSQALARVREAARSLCRHSPEVGAVCGKAARTVLCGGCEMKLASLPLQWPHVAYWHLREVSACSIQIRFAAQTGHSEKAASLRICATLRPEHVQQCAAPTRSPRRRATGMFPGWSDRSPSQ
jgi:hypothetical protein